MPHRPHSSRALLLAASLTLLTALGGCVRLRESASSDPSAAGNIALAQVVSTVSPESTPADPTVVAAEPTQDATAVPTPSGQAATEVPASAETPSPSATADPATTAPAPTPTRVPCQLGAFEDPVDVVAVEDHEDDSGAPQNEIKICNRKDDRLRIRGRIQINRIPGNTVQPVNHALAWNSCVGCKSVVIALQMNLLSRTASTIAPRNEADSYNYACNRCVAVALAYQYNHQVDNPREVPDDVRRLTRELNDELRSLQTDRNVTLEQAIPRIQGVIDRFYELNVDLDQRRQETRDDDTPGGQGD